MTENRSRELKIFRQFIEDEVQPLLGSFNLKRQWIDEDACALYGPDFCFKIYCPQDTGYNFTACIAPEYKPVKNADNERGLPWLVMYLGVHCWKHETYETPEAFKNGLSSFSKILPYYIDYLTNVHRDLFWEEFYWFVDDRIGS
jgi:hypothetical protein